MAEQQSLADLTEALRAQLFGGSDTVETNDTVEPWRTFQCVQRASALSNEQVPGALFRLSDAGDRMIVERRLTPYLQST
jgi:hypothetical protein